MRHEGVLRCLHFDKRTVDFAAHMRRNDGDPVALDETARALHAALAVVRGHFLYESGHHGDLWLDLNRLFVDAPRMRGWSAELARRTQGCRAEVVCGPLIGGALLAQFVAGELGAEFVFAERSAPEADGLHYRLPQSLRRSVKARRVLLVDDAVNAGSAWRSTLAELDECGAQLVGLATLVTLGDAARRCAAQRSVPLHALATLEHGLWAPDDCPLCRLGRRLTYE